MSNVRILLLAVFFGQINLAIGQGFPDINPTPYVNPFIGTDGTGHSFPGASVPFGVVQPSPDNVDIGWDYTSGYQFKDSTFLGFSNIHFSGTGISEGGNVLLLPYLDSLPGFKTGYRKGTERAEPGYYTVMLRQRVRVELTASEHVAFHKYTYLGQGTPKVYLDLQHGLRFLDKPLVQACTVEWKDNQTLVGYIQTQNWVNRRLYFQVSFSEPIAKFSTLEKRPGEVAPRFILYPSLKPNRLLMAKVSISTTGIEGASLNQTQLPDWDFDKVRADASQAWREILGRIAFTAPEPEKENLYTSLYHLCLQPNNIADLDGRYRGADDSVRMSPSSDNRFYSTFSIWDAYRAAFPLYTLVAPDRVEGMVASLLAQAKAQGFFPVYAIGGQENFCMIGNHSIPMVVSAWARGFKNFDAKAALALMVKSTTINHTNSDWPVLNQYGYYPYDKVETESASRTAESGVDDAAIAWFAEQLGEKAFAETYRKRAGYYLNLMDPETHLLRGKNAAGAWRTPFDPLKPTSPMNNPGDYTEANAWQYTWTPAQHDVLGLEKALGGAAGFSEKLHTFFTLQTPNPNKHLGQEALIGQYAHGNEVSHHVAWLFAFTDKPEEGAGILSHIYKDFYKPTPDGLIGNEDCGAMSAWYLYAALGFYPVNPFNGLYVLAHPQVRQASIRVGDKTLIIENQGGSAANTLHINGAQHLGVQVPHAALQQAGHWVWTLVPKK